ncbi:MAG: hypothetical protein WA958_01705 [Tunicatimonas sp.]
MKLFDKKIVGLFFTVVLLSTYHTNAQIYNKGLSKFQFTHFSTGFEIGSNYLDISSLNDNTSRLNLLAVDPYFNNFTFQALAGFGRIEPYLTISFLSSSSFTRTVDSNRLFRSTSFEGIYSGLGLRLKAFSLFRDRLSLFVSGEGNIARYFLTLSSATINIVSLDSIFNNSKTIIANTNDLVLQPSFEVLYSILKKRNSFDIGIKIGFLYHLERNEWRTQHQMPLSLSPVGNSENYNFSLRMVYSFSRCE